MNHMDFTPEQAEEILRRAGLIAAARAKTAFDLGIVDPMTMSLGLGAERRCADLIDYMIRSEEGLGWSGRDEYHSNNDGFQWCGAFAAYCMPYVKLELRVVYWASTDRLNAYAQHKLLFGSEREKRLARAHPKLSAAYFESQGRQFTAAYQRQYGVFDEDSRRPPLGAREGDILLVGPAFNPRRETANWRPFGQHVTVLRGPAESIDGDAGIPGRLEAQLPTYEGNATGEIPGRDETRTRPVQGVISTTRQVGLRSSDSRDKYHARRWMRPSFFDIDLDLFIRYGGLLP